MFVQDTEHAIELLKGLIEDLERATSVVLYYNAEAHQLVPQPSHVLRSMTISWSVPIEGEPQQ